MLSHYHHICITQGHITHSPSSFPSSPSHLTTYHPIIYSYRNNPTGLYRNAAGTILEDYLSRCPTVLANGTFGLDNTTHGILTIGKFAPQSNNIDQSNIPVK